MKKILCLLLALVMLAGLGVGAGAAPPDTSTWPVLALNQPVDLDYFGESEDSEGNMCPAYMSTYQFIPAESGWYFYEILGPASLGFSFVYVMTNEGTSEWDDADTLPLATQAVHMEGGGEYFVVAQAIGAAGSTGVFQLAARKVDETVTLKCWQRLPCWLQWILRWVCFGWIWMK